MADRDDVATLGDVNLLYSHRYSQHDGLEGQREVLLDRRVKSNSLFGLGVRIDDGFLDESVETCRRDPWAPR